MNHDDRLKKKSQEPAPTKEVLGWREWIELPSLGVKKIKAKVDSGARTSALHVTHIKKKGKSIIFNIHPTQNDAEPVVTAKAKVLEYRFVKSSNGVSDMRPVIQAQLKVGSAEYSIELTLVNRDLMGFRMLLGREAVRKRFLIDPGKSFLIKKRSKKKSKKDRAKK